MIRDLFFNNCEHEQVRKMEKRIWEHKCDKCHKILFAKEEGDFCIERNAEYLRIAQNDDLTDPLLA